MHPTKKAAHIAGALYLLLVLTARGRLVKRGQTVGMAECDVLNTEGELVARASSTCMALRGEQARGR